MSESIDSTMQENRTFPPPAAFAAKARIKSMDEYRSMWQRSIDQPDEFFAEHAQQLTWFKPWTKVLEWNEPYAKWFVGATTNLSHNCLDRVIEDGHGDKVAIIWEGEPVDDASQPEAIVKLTYKQLHERVCRFANGLKKLGVGKGDVVTLYLPMVPEAVIAMLACARIGAPHSVIFGGFSAQSIVDRVEDAKSRFVITADFGYRRGKPVPLKANVDEALKQTSLVEKVVVLRRETVGASSASQPSSVQGKEIDWHTLEAEDPHCPAVPMDAEDQLFVLYTSGSTGKPKGIIHTTGGYMLHVYMTFRYVFDIQDKDVFWCTADVGWVTGHSYITYGPLLNAATVMMYEGAPNHPDFGRLWEIVDRHDVSIFYTAPTAIRAFMRAGTDLIDGKDLSSLRLLGTVGEPINPEAWMWYHRTIGKEKCPIVDTWWQTETGGMMITPLPGATPTKPGTATLPFFGVDAAIVDRDGKEQPANTGGLLVIRKPWPGMLRGILNDPERYQKTYWSDVKGMYFTGDGARRDEDGYFWIMGRMDDVLNVSGHRLGTAEVESALVSHPSVAEAAVVGMPHDIKGQGVAAFVTVRGHITPDDSLRKELIDTVARQIGAIAKPDMIRFTDALPKTRSGKIMRRLLKEIAAGGEVKGDVTTLEDFSVVAKLRGTEE